MQRAVSRTEGSVNQADRSRLQPVFSPRLSSTITAVVMEYVVSLRNLIQLWSVGRNVTRLGRWQPLGSHSMWNSSLLTSYPVLESTLRQISRALPSSSRQLGLSPHKFPRARGSALRTASMTERQRLLFLSASRSLHEKRSRRPMTLLSPRSSTSLTRRAFIVHKDTITPQKFSNSRGSRSSGSFSHTATNPFLRGSSFMSLKTLLLPA